jgi:flagellar protein FlaG
MSEQVLKSVAVGTGTLPILQERIQVDSAASSGRKEPAAGKVLPERRADSREETGPDLDRLVHELNLTSRSIGSDLRFRVDLESGDAVIEVLDRETGEIVRQIPGDKAIKSLNSGHIANIRLFDELV